MVSFFLCFYKAENDQKSNILPEKQAKKAKFPPFLVLTKRIQRLIFSVSVIYNGYCSHKDFLNPKLLRHKTGVKARLPIGVKIQDK